MGLNFTHSKLSAMSETAERIDIYPINKLTKQSCVVDVQRVTLQLFPSLHFPGLLFHCFYSLVGLVVKASASGAVDPGFESRLRRDFSGSVHTSDLKTGTPVATLPAA